MRKSRRLITCKVNSHHKIQLKATWYIIQKTVLLLLHKLIHKQLTFQNLILKQGISKDSGIHYTRSCTKQLLAPSHDLDEMARWNLHHFFLYEAFPAQQLISEASWKQIKIKYISNGLNHRK